MLIKDLKELFNVSEFFIVKKNHGFDFSKIGIREKLYISEDVTEVFEKIYHLVLNDMSIVEVPAMVNVVDLEAGTTFFKDELDISFYMEEKKLLRSDVKAIVVHQLKKRNEDFIYDKHSVYWLN